MILMIIINCFRLDISKIYNQKINIIIKKNLEFTSNGPAGIRTQDLTVISRALYRLSHGPLILKKGFLHYYLKYPPK